MAVRWLFPAREIYNGQAQCRSQEAHVAGLVLVRRPQGRIRVPVFELHTRQGPVFAAPTVAVGTCGVAHRAECGEWWVRPHVTRV
jgi:hypothetical protein